MTHGGKREGAGRKASRGEAKIVTTINVTPELKAYLSQCEQSQSEVVEDAIRRTKAFREWKAKSGERSQSTGREGEATIMKDHERGSVALGCYPPVLDACCGSRMFWFDQSDERAIYVDKRRETHPIDKGTPGTKGRKPIVVDPDVQADFTDLPFPDDTFRLVVFDPPHIQRDEAKGILTKKYGHLKGDWRQMLREGFAECFRVLMPGGVLIFKWAESEVAVSEILKLTPEKPLFGHKSGKAATTHWVTFIKCG